MKCRIFAYKTPTCPSCFHPKNNLSSTYCNKMLNGTMITAKSTSNPMLMINSALMRDLTVLDQYQLDYEWVRIQVWFWAEVLTGHYIASGTNETKQSPLNRLKNKSMSLIKLESDGYGFCWVNRKAQYVFSCRVWWSRILPNSKCRGYGVSYYCFSRRKNINQPSNDNIVGIGWVINAKNASISSMHTILYWFGTNEGKHYWAQVDFCCKI